MRSDPAEAELEGEILAGGEKILRMCPGTPAVIPSDAHLLHGDADDRVMNRGQLVDMSGGLQLMRCPWEDVDREIVTEEFDTATAAIDNL